MTPADYESMEHAGHVLHERGWRKKFSVDEMTGAWRQLIGLIEAGYDQLVYEYINDLSCREWIALAWPMLTEHVRSVRQAEVDALDGQFIAATTEDKEGKLAQFYRVDAADGWWWQRIPTRRRGE